MPVVRWVRNQRKKQVERRKIRQAMRRHLQQQEERSKPASATSSLAQRRLRRVAAGQDDEGFERDVQRQFVEAALEGDVPLLKQLLEKYSKIIDVNGTHDGRSRRADVGAKKPSSAGGQRVWKVWHRVTALQAACKTGQVGAVTCLLQHPEIDPNISIPRLAPKDECDASPLIHAARAGHAKVVDLLLTSASLDVNQFDQRWGTALHQACLQGHVGVLQSLVEYESKHLDEDRIDWNIRHLAEDGKTPLQVAILQKHTALVEFMLEQAPNVNVNATDFAGSSALQYAIAIHSLECVTMLLAHPKVDMNQPNVHGNTALHTAVLMNKPSTRVIDEEEDPDIFSAAFILDANRNYSNNNTTTSMTALAILQALVRDPKLDPNHGNHEGYTPLHMAVVLQRPLPILESLLEEPRSEAKANNTTTHTVNIVDSKGSTALHHAWKTKHLPAIQCLVHHPAIDLNITFSQGWTQLHLLTARLKNVKPSTVSLFVPETATTPTNSSVARVVDENALLTQQEPAGENENGADNDAAQEDQVSTSRSATNSTGPSSEEVDWIVLLHYLLRQPAIDINAQDNDGDTALHMACLCGAAVVQEALVHDPRTDAAILNRQGQTAWDLIAENENSKDDYLIIAISVQISHSLNQVLEDFSHASKDLTRGKSEEAGPGEETDKDGEKKDENDSLTADALGIVLLWLEDVRRSRRMALRKMAVSAVPQTVEKLDASGAS